MPPIPRIATPAPLVVCQAESEQHFSDMQSDRNLAGAYATMVEQLQDRVEELVAARGDGDTANAVGISRLSAIMPAESGYSSFEFEHK